MSTRSFVASLQAALAKHKITCGAVAGYTDLSPTAAAEVPYLEMQIAYVESLAQLATQLGASDRAGLHRLRVREPLAPQHVVERRGEDTA